MGKTSLIKEAEYNIELLKQNIEEVKQYCNIRKIDYSKTVVQFFDDNDTLILTLNSGRWYDAICNTYTNEWETKELLKKFSCYDTANFAMITKANIHVNEETCYTLEFDSIESYSIVVITNKNKTLYIKNTRQKFEDFIKTYCDNWHGNCIIEYDENGIISEVKSDETNENDDWFYMIIDKLDDVYI